MYGTLMYPEVLTALLGRVPDRSAGTAPGHRAAALPGRPYPGLVPHQGGRATGLVLGGLTAAELRLLDAYENPRPAPDYAREPLTLDGGRRCVTYVWLGPVLPADWDAGAFAATTLDTYAAGCARWRATYLNG